MILYKITCLETGKIYIGITRYDKLRRRWLQHWDNSRRKPHITTPLYIEMRAVPRDRWTIEAISTHSSYDELLLAERAAIETYRATDPGIGYNRTSGGQGCLGLRFTKTAAQIERSARFHRGRKRSPETTALLRAHLAALDRSAWATKSKPERDVAIMWHYFSSPSLANTGAAFGIKAAAVSIALRRCRGWLADAASAWSPIYSGIELPRRIHPDHLEGFT